MSAPATNALPLPAMTMPRTAGSAAAAWKAALQLREDGFVQRVHRVGAIDGQRGDAIGDLGTHEREVERPAGTRLVVDRSRDAHVPARGKRGDEVAGAREAEVIHQLERAAPPAEADPRADVGILDRPDAFVDERAGDETGRGRKAIANGRESRRIGRAVDGPLRAGVDLGTKERR